MGCRSKNATETVAGKPKRRLRKLLVRLLVLGVGAAIFSAVRSRSAAPVPTPAPVPPPRPTPVPVVEEPVAEAPVPEAPLVEAVETSEPVGEALADPVAEAEAPLVEAVEAPTPIADAIPEDDAETSDSIPVVTAEIPADSLTSFFDEVMTETEERKRRKR